MAVHLVNLMVRNTQSKPPKAHFSAIHSLQLVPANIRGTREFAGEITSNKGLGFITLHIFTRFILHFQKTLVEELLKWISAHYGMLVLSLLREVFKDFAEASKMPWWPPQRPGFPHWTESGCLLGWGTRAELNRTENTSRPAQRKSPTPRQQGRGKAQSSSESGRPARAACRAQSLLPSLLPVWSRGAARAAACPSASPRTLLWPRGWTAVTIHTRLELKQ